MSQDETKTQMRERGKDATIPKALDGGWAWMITLGMGMSFALGMGYQKVFTILYHKLSQVFGESASATAAVQGVTGAVSMFIGPFASTLCKKYGHRRVVIAGGLCAGIGGILSSFAPSLFVLYLSHGLLIGIGFGSMNAAAFSMTALYFKKKRGLALGLGTAANAVGLACWTTFMTWSLDFYGFHGTMLICGGILFNICVAGSLYRPLADNYPHYKQTSTVTQLECKDLSVPGNSRDTEEMTHDRNCHVSPGNVNSRESHKKQSTCITPCYGLWKSCKQSFDLDLLRKPIFVLFCIQMIGVSYEFMTHSIFLFSLLTEKGFSQKQFSYFFIALAVIDAFARILSGFLFDVKLIRHYLPLVHVMCGVLSCVGMYSLASINNTYGVYIAGVIYQVGLGSHNGQHINSLAHLVGQQKVTGAIGLVRFCQGVSVVVTATVGGHIRDSTGHFMYCYIVAASFSLLTLITFVVNYMYMTGNTRACSKQRKQRSESVEL